MAEEGEDDASKTEEATPKKLEDARKKGQIAQSREINHFFILLAFTFMVMLIMPYTGSDMLAQFTPFVQAPDEIQMSGQALNDLFEDIVFGFLLVIAFPVSAAFIAAILPSVVQNKVVLTAEQIKPKLSKISPIAGFKRLFGKKAWIEFVKNFLKIVVVGAIGYAVSIPFHDVFPTFINMSLTGTLGEGQSMAARILIAVCVFLFFLAIVDYLIARQMHLKELRMSKKEVKDEHKQQEGDPHVKARQRQIQRERSRKRMMAAVPEADVIITNPTHFAVALKYDRATMPAPMVIAKGADKVAHKIRDIAQENRIPVLRNPPLARVIYDTVEVDEEIPYEHYAAVAKVISYVYQLRGEMSGWMPQKKQ
jgi:flagellar biosynthetic protein FlhB